MHCINLSLDFKFHYWEYSNMCCPNPFSAILLLWEKGGIRRWQQEKATLVWFSYMSSTYHRAQGWGLSWLCGRMTRRQEKRERAGQRGITLRRGMFRTKCTPAATNEMMWRILSKPDDLNNWYGITYNMFRGHFLRLFRIFGKMLFNMLSPCSQLSRIWKCHAPMWNYTIRHE